MAFLAGELMTAQRVNRLQPTPYFEGATGTVAVSQTNVIIPGCSISLTTETNNATVKIDWFATFQAGGTAPTTNGNCIPLIDGVTTGPQFTLADIRTINEKVTIGGVWITTIATAGAHTIALRATTPANVTISNYCGISAVVFEVV